jgi:hypothetical protein
VEEVTHHLVGANSPPDFYTIKEEVEFAITIKERKNGVWVPFTGTDVQVFIFYFVLTIGIDIWIKKKPFLSGSTGKRDTHMIPVSGWLILISGIRPDVTCRL